MADSPQYPDEEQRRPEEQEQQPEEPQSWLRRIVRILIIIVLLGIIYHFGSQAIYGFKAYKGVEKAQKLINEQKYDEAIDMLEPLADKKTRYRGNVLFELGRAYESKGQQAVRENEHEKAVQYLEKAYTYYAKTEEVPGEQIESREQIDVLRQIIDAHYGTKDYGRMADAARRWLELEPESEEAKRMLHMATKAEEGLQRQKQQPEPAEQPEKEEKSGKQE